MSIDVGLDETGDLPHFTRHISGPAVTLQRLALRLKTFLGEWILDASVGIPYLDFIAQKPPRLNEIGAFIRREIETTPGVIAIDEFASTHDAEARRITFTVTIRIEDSPELVVVEVFPRGVSGNSSPAVLFNGRQGTVLAGLVGRTP